MNRKKIEMTRKCKPVITNTEILARAIRSVDEEMQALAKIASQIPEDKRREWLDPQVNPLKEKREALNMLYCIETGCDYD